MHFPINTDKPKVNSEKKSSSLKSENSAKITERNSSFLSLLESIVPSTNEETRGINELWQKLPDVEKKFLNQPSSLHLEEYKKLVKDIIKEILKNNTKLVQARQRGRNDNKVLMTVKIIDETIHLLASTMLSSNNSAFSLLKQMEKIRGLLTDIKE